MGDFRGSLEGQIERSYFPEILYLLKRDKQYILILSLMMGLGTIINNLLYIPVFVSSANLEVLSQKENLLSRGGALAEMGGIGYSFDTSQEIQRHALRLKSGSFYQKVVDRLLLSPEFSSMNLTRPSELSIFHRKFWETRFKKSHSVQLKIDFKNTEKEAYRNYLASVIQEATTVSTEGSTWITLTVKTFDPKTSLLLVNLEAEVYVQLALDQERDSINELQAFITDRLHEADEKMQEEKNSLVELKQHYGLLTLEESGKIYTEQIREVQTKLSTAKLKLRENQDLIRFYEEKIAHHADFVMNEDLTEKKGSDLFALTRKLDDLSRQRYLLVSQGISESDPAFVNLTQMIKSIAGSLNKKTLRKKNKENRFILNTAALQAKIGELSVVNGLLLTEIQSLEKVKEDAMGSISNFPKIEQDLFGKSENLRINFELYSSLKKKFQEIEFEKLAIKPPVRMDSLFDVAPREVRISLLLRLPFSLLVGAFLGCLLILIFEAGNTTIRHVSDLEEADLTVLGDLPDIPLMASQRDELGYINPSELLVCKKAPNSSAAMAFKYVREQIRASSHGNHPIRSIVISGTDKHEGKTFFAVNIAISLAGMNNKKVLVVDCNLREPTVHKYFGVPNVKGMSEVLEQDEFFLSDYVVSGGVGRLDIIPAGEGAHHPTELVGGDHFKRFLDQALDEYDYILIDSPSAVHLADAPVMAGVADAVILVASYRVTKRSTLLTAHKKIFQISRRYAYSILNHVPTEIHETSPYIAKMERGSV